MNFFWRSLLLPLLVLAIVFLQFPSLGGVAAKATQQMVVTSSGIQNGIIDKKYGKYGTEFLNGMPSYSLPLKITGAPKGTRSYSIVLLDHDSVPVCGFSWIHWTVANLTVAELPENASINPTGFIQGATSWSSGLMKKKVERLDSARYGGMTPPDKPHQYELKVYALDCLLDLQPGFYLNELYKTMENHTLATATLTGIYQN